MSRLISMDLGSESSFAIFYAEGMMGDGLEVDLQHYAYVQTDKPLFHTESGKKSHGLRTRFFRGTVNAAWSSGGQQLDWSVVSHPLVADSDEYQRAVESGGTIEATPAALGPIRYFLTEGGGFPLVSWLPNAKIAFSILPQQKVRFELANRTSLYLTPRDIIKVQLGQILNQFVLQNPEVIGETSAWEEQYFGEPKESLPPLQIILTVPNSYAPQHTSQIHDFVKEVCPNAEVRTISESDAVVLDYYNKFSEEFLAGDGVRPEEFNDYILTIDIGKGTTDATVASLEFGPYALPNGQRAHGLQVTPCTRTGRVTGGAMLTYIFLEFIQDLAIDVLRDSEWVKSHPRIHTEKNEALEIQPPFVSHLIQVEEYCHQLKVHWDPKGADVLDGDLDPDLGRAVAVGMVQMWQQAALGRRDYQSFSVAEVRGADFPEGFLEADKESNDAIKRLAALLNRPADLLKVLASRNTAQVGAYGLRAEWALTRFDKLKEDIKRYVFENVDDVLMDLAYGMLTRSTEHGEEFGSAEAALEYFTKAEHPSLAMRKFRPAIHLVIAGKGSLFKPIKRRLKELAQKVRVTVVDSEAEVGGGSASRGLKVEGLKEALMQILQKIGTRPNPELPAPEASSGLAKSLVYFVSSDECKIMCARGGRQWARHRVSTLRNVISGVLTLKVAGKGEVPVPMAALNENQIWRYEFSDASGLQLRAGDLAYAPSRYLSRRKDRSGTFAKALQFDACFGIELRLVDGQLLVYRLVDGDDGLVPQRHRARVQAADVTNLADMPEEMFPMVWPAILKPRSMGQGGGK